MPTPAPRHAPAPAPAPADVLTKFCTDELAGATAARDAVYAVSGAHTVANTLEAYNELSRHIANAANRGNLWKEVSPDAATRDAARECAQKAFEARV